MAVKTIAIDPGTQVSGFAVFHGKRLWSWETYKVRGEPIARIMSMTDWLYERAKGVLGAAPPGSLQVVIEVPGGQSKARGRGLITMGMGAGAVVRSMYERGYKVRSVPAGTWTRRVPKDKRAEMIERTFPTYSIDKDSKTLEGADAIGLGAWQLSIPLRER